MDIDKERAEFEVWVRKQNEFCLDWTGNDLYDHSETMKAWAAWQARAALASQDTAPPAAVPAPDLHAAIMNIPCKVAGAVFANWTRDEQDAYTAGHRDARHAAAELAASQQAAAPAQAVDAMRYTSDGALAECPCCGSLDVGGAHNTVHCYACDLTIKRVGPLQNAIDAWNRRTRAALAAQPAAPDTDIFDLIREWAHLPEGKRGHVARKIIGCLNRSYSAGVADGRAIGELSAKASPVANAGQKVASSGGKVASEVATLVGRAQAVAVPDGTWQLVPLLPTEEMEVAFAEVWFSRSRPIDDVDMADAYAAMLAAAPLPQQVAQPFPTSRDAYEKMTPERKVALDADLKGLEQRIESHRRNRDRRTHDEPVAEERRHGDRRHAERRDAED